MTDNIVLFSPQHLNVKLNHSSRTGLPLQVGPDCLTSALLKCFGQTEDAGGRSQESCASLHKDVCQLWGVPVLELVNI